MEIFELFLEKIGRDKINPVYRPAHVLLKKDGTKVRYSWHDYKEKTLQAIEGLKLHSVKARDFVAVIPLNLPESFFAILGCILMGAIPVPINTLLLKETGHKELKKILDNCQPTLVLGNGCLKDMLPEFCITVEQIISEGEDLLTGRSAGKNVNPSPRQANFPNIERKPQDLIIMPYTSGTTGKPKGVMLSEEAILDRIAAIINELEITEKDVLLSYLSLGHISELVATFFSQIYAGYTVYFTEQIDETVKDREKFKKIFRDILRATPTTIFLAVPKIWENIYFGIEEELKVIPKIFRKFPPVKKIISRKVKEGLFPKTRLFISAGSDLKRIGREKIDAFRQWGIPIDDIYGQTETAGPILINGRPIGQDVDVILDGQTEEILIRTPSLMLGYYHNPEATVEKIKERRGQKFFYSGDAGMEGHIARKGPEYPWLIQIVYAGRLDDSGKGKNGEYYSTPKLYEMENQIKHIPTVKVEEVIIAVEGLDGPVALIFIDTQQSDCSLELEKIKNEIRIHLQKIGEGMYKIRSFYLLNKNDLEWTPTMKVKRKAVIKKFRKLIEQTPNK